MVGMCVCDTFKEKKAQAQIILACLNSLFIGSEGGMG